MSSWDGVHFDDDLIPDVDLGEYPDVAGYIRQNLDIRSIYNAYVRKENGVGRDVSGGRETFIRCPSPAHVDRKPSAWMNEQSKTWYCGVCAKGGDALSLVAFAWGYDVPGFQADPTQFREVIDSIAEQFRLSPEDIAARGYVKEIKPPDQRSSEPKVVEWPADFNSGEREWAEQLLKAWEDTGRGMEDIISAIYTDREVRVANAHIQHENGVDVNPAVALAIERELGGHSVPRSRIANSYEDAVDKGIIEELGIDPSFPCVDWEAFLPVDTPLRTAMEALCVDDAPDEFHMWSLYTVVGAMIGRSVEYTSHRGNISPSFWTILSGPSGYRKSSVADPMRDALSEVAPENADLGVKMLHRPASGEAFIANLKREHEDVDPSTGLPIFKELPNCSSLMHSDELSTLLAVVNRSGGLLGPLLTETYNCKRDRVIANTAALGREANEVTGPMLSILSTTQPSRISDLLSARDVMSGFVNRFTFVHGRPRRRVLMDSQVYADYEVVKESLRSIDDCLRALNAYSGRTAVNPKKPMFLQFEDYFKDQDIPNGPLEKFQEWGVQIEARIKEIERGGGEYAADMLRRVDLTVRKLTILMTINRIAGNVDIRPYIVSEDVEQALAHVDNLIASLEEIGVQIVQSDFSKFEDWILEKVKEAGAAGVQRRTLHNKMPGFYKKAGIKFADAIMGLINSGAIIDDLRPATKPVKERTAWLVHPDYMPQDVA